MNFTQSSRPLLLIYNSMSPPNGTTEYDIMLSPQFYTTKRENLPIRYRYQAKKLAPSVLEGLLPLGRDYDYYTFKDGDEWVFVAYDMEEIVTFLGSIGVDRENIFKLYFAEQVASKFMPPVTLDEQNVLSTIQNSATVIPKAVLPIDTTYRSFGDEFRPQEGLSFASSASGLLGQKEALIFGAIFLAFGVIFFIEGFWYSQATSSVKQEVTELLEDYPALQSQYARDNIAKKYLKIDKEERGKREVLKGLSKMVLPGVQIDSLVVQKNHFVYMLKLPDEKSLLRVKALAKAREYKTSRVGNKNILKIEGGL